MTNSCGSFYIFAKRLLHLRLFEWYFQYFPAVCSQRKKKKHWEQAINDQQLWVILYFWHCPPSLAALLILAGFSPLLRHCWRFVNLFFPVPLRPRPLLILFFCFYLALLVSFLWRLFGCPCSCRLDCRRKLNKINYRVYKHTHTHTHTHSGRRQAGLPPNHPTNYPPVPFDSRACAHPATSRSPQSAHSCINI